MPRNLVVINFSGAFPAAARERVDALEVVRTTLKAGGVLYTDALLDSSNPYSSLADLLTPFARGSVLDRDGQPSCGSIGNARTIFHHMRSKGYASTFIGAFGIPTDEDEHDAAMRRRRGRRRRDGECEDPTSREDVRSSCGCETRRRCCSPTGRGAPSQGSLD